MSVLGRAILDLCSEPKSMAGLRVLGRLWSALEAELNTIHQIKKICLVVTRGFAEYETYITQRLKDPTMGLHKIP